MSTFIAAVFTVILTLIAIGKFIWAVVVAYRSLTWFLTHFDELPISGHAAGDITAGIFSAVSTVASSVADFVIQRHAQPGQPAQTAPGGEHHLCLTGFPFADSSWVHRQPVGQLQVSQGISPGPRKCH